MIRTDRLVVSRPHYAFNAASWSATTIDCGARYEPYTRYTVDAVWFKRKDGVLVATMGTYHPMVNPRRDNPADGAYESWVAAADDNRHGGSWLASWNGTALLNFDHPTPDECAERIAFLSDVLHGFPDPPAGWDGWLTFPKVRK